MSGVLNVLLGLGGGAKIVFSGASIQDVGFVTAEAALELRADGSAIAIRTATGNINLGNWIDPAPPPNPGDYTVRADVTSGTLSAGTTGTDLTLNSTRRWTVLRNSPGTSTVFMTLTFKFNGITLAQTNVTIEAVVNP